MNGLHAMGNHAVANDGESLAMQALRKEVMIMCAAIILGSAPIDANADLACRMSVTSHTASALVAGKVPSNIPMLQEKVHTQNIGDTVPQVKTPIASTSEQDMSNITSLTKNPIRHGTVNGPMSVERFMLDNFGTKDGWELLVDAGTVGSRGGDRVRKANRDLYRGHTYFLARSPEEATMLSKIIREKGKNGIEQITINPSVSVKKERKNKKAVVAIAKKDTYTVTRADMSEEENQFLVDISKKEKYIDKGEMYHFRAQADEFQKIASQVGIGPEHIPVIHTLMSHLAKGETHWNYGALGPIIRHKSIHQGHHAIGLTQIMPIYWIKWSQKHFHTILDTTDINQERLGFAQIAEYYKRYLEQGESFKNIVNNLSLDWYGRIRVKGLIAPTQYQKEYVHSVFLDADRVTEANKIISQYRENKIAGRKNINPSEIQASLLETPVTQGIETVSLQENTVALAQERTNALIDEQMRRMNPRFAHSTQGVIEDVGVDTKDILNTPVAANDPKYFIGSQVIKTGMHKVIDLSKYLKDKNGEREAEKTFKTRLPAIGNTINLCQKELANPVNKADLKLIIENQIQLGNALTEAMTLANNVVPNSVFTNGIEEAKTKMAKVISFQAALEKSLAQKAKQKAEKQRQENGKERNAQADMASIKNMEDYMDKKKREETNEHRRALNIAALGIPIDTMEDHMKKQYSSRYK